MSVFALELEHVSKCFGNQLALEDLSLALEPGAFLGLLGRNGAGKSTTIKIATGLIDPSAGSVRVMGIDLALEPLAVKRLIGAMPEDMALLEMLTGPQYLRFVGRMHGLAEATIARRQDELFATLDLAPGPRTLIADYSFGMKKKLAFSAALVHDPRVVFLDEPFEGVDPVAARTMKEILVALRRRGVTLVLTTHILDVVERLCSHVAVLECGRLRASGTLEAMREGGDGTLEGAFLRIVGRAEKGGLSWL